MENVPGHEGQVLNPRAFIVLQIGLYLTLPLGPENRLIQWQEDSLVVVGQNDRVQATIRCPHVLRCELCELMKPCELLHVRQSRAQLGHVAHRVVKPPNPIIHRISRGTIHRLKPREEPRIGSRWVRGLVPVLVADVPQNDVPVEVNLRQHSAAIEGHGPGHGFPPVGHAGGESHLGVLHLHGDGAYPKAVGEGEFAAGVVGEGWYGGDGRRFGGRDGGGVGCSEEEAEVAGAAEVGRMDGVTGGEVGLGHEGHAKAPGEAAGGVGGVGAPELHVVEPDHPEPVGSRVDPDEVLEPDKLELCSCVGFPHLGLGLFFTTLFPYHRRHRIRNRRTRRRRYLCLATYTVEEEERRDVGETSTT